MKNHYPVKSIPSSRCIQTLFLISLILLPGIATVHGEIYKWTDRNGKVYFTDTIDAVPPEYRSTIEEKASAPRPSSSPAKQPAPTPVSYTIPLYRVGNALFVDVVFNDTVSVRMLVDTGATDTLISPRVAQQLRLDPHNADIIPVQTANGLTLVPVMQIASMSVGKATAYNVDVSVHDAGLPGGLLGMSFLDNFQFSIDRSKMILIPLTARSGDVLSDSRSENWWRGRFHFYQRIITNIETYLKKHQPSPEFKTKLEKSRDFFQQKLDNLDRKASLAGIPRRWRD